MDPADMVCRNCAHFLRALPVSVPVGGAFLTRRFCCKAHFSPDAGEGAVVLVGPESACTGAINCVFQPSGEYLDTQDYSLEVSPDDLHNLCGIYGVLPGIDFPATLEGRT